MEGTKSKDKKAGRDAKKPKFSNKVQCETDGVSEADCDVKSFRIYANPKGEGYAIEEKFRKAGEDKKSDERRIRVVNAPKFMDISRKSLDKKYNQIKGKSISQKQ